MFKVIEGIVVDGGEPGRIFGECGIYNASCNVGYSGAPTKITLNVIAKDLQTLNTHVNKTLLETNEDGVGPLGHEVEGQAINGHTIKFGNVTFSNMYLYSYAYNVTAGAKTATLSYVDFSQAFDKIHVGLVGRHDTQRADSLVYKKQINPDRGDNWWLDNSDNGGNHFYHLMENVGFQVVCLECNSLSPRRLLWPGKKTPCDCVGTVQNPCGVGTVPCVGPDGNAVAIGTLVDMQPGDPAARWPWNNPQLTPTNHTIGVKNRTGVDGWDKWDSTAADWARQTDTARVSRFVQVAGANANGYWVSSNLRTGNWKTAVNGGYVTIGREAFQETNCEIGKVEYYFQDLVNVIDEMNIDHNLNDLKFKRRACSESMQGTCYAANYTGTLREVLTAWGADLAFDWTIDSTGEKPKLTAVDLVSGADLDEVRTAIETSFDGSQGGMIKNYSTNVTKENTYKAEPLVKYIKPPRTIQREHQHDEYKEAKTITVSDAIGNVANLGRTYSDLYMSIGLAKYSPEARLMWLSDQASNKRETQAWFTTDGDESVGGYDSNGQWNASAQYEWPTPCNCDPDTENCHADTIPCGTVGNTLPLGTKVPRAYPMRTIKRQKYGVSPGGPIGVWEDKKQPLKDNANNITGFKRRWRGETLNNSTLHAESASVPNWPGDGTIGSSIKSGAFVSLGFFPLTTLTDNLRSNNEGIPALRADQYIGVVSTVPVGPNCNEAPPGLVFPTPNDPALQKPAGLKEGEPCTGMFKFLPEDKTHAQWTYWCKGAMNRCPGQIIPGAGGGDVWPKNMPVTFPLTQNLQAYAKKSSLLQKFARQKGGEGNNLVHPIWQNPDSYEVWIGIYNEQYQDAVAQFDAELAEDFVGKYGMFYEQLSKSYNYCPEYDVMSQGVLDSTEEPVVPPVHRFHQISLETATIPESEIYSGHSYPFKKILKVNDGQFNPDSVPPPSDYSAAPLAGGRPWERGHTTLGKHKNKSVFDIEDNAWGTAQANVDWALENPYNVGHIEQTFGNDLQRQIMMSDLHNFVPIYSYFDGRRGLNTELAGLFNNYEHYVNAQGQGEYSGYRGGIAIIPKLDGTHPSTHKDPNFRGKPIATGFNGKKILEVQWGNGEMHWYDWATDLAQGNINNPAKRHLPGGDDAFIFCSEFPQVVGCNGKCTVSECHNFFQQGITIYWPDGHWRNPSPSAVEAPDGSIDYIKVFEQEPVGVHPITGDQVSWGPLGPPDPWGGASSLKAPAGYDNPIGGLKIADVQTNPKVFRNAERRARKWFEDSQPKQDCTLYCEENVVEDVCECKPYEEPNHGFLSYKSYVMNLKHLGRYVKIIYPVESTYSGYFSAKSTMRGTIAKQQQVVGSPDSNPGNVMGTRITEIDATSDINAIEEDSNVFHSKIVAKTPQGDMKIYDLPSYYSYLKGMSQDISEATETVSVRLDGTHFAGLSDIMDAAHGLSSFSISLDGEGVSTDLTFADRPPKLPKRDVLLQKLGPRLMDGKISKPNQMNIAGGARHNH
tara:strand:- start:2713 stop:7221 length:4509 start_codon:yes stop_codon:yes gene_type:complete